MAPTLPSIMSDGATRSAPARACATASRASSGRVRSLSTVSPWPGPPADGGRSTPQWPWSVYSHRHTSVITTSPGTRSLRPRIARGTTPSSS